MSTTQRAVVHLPGAVEVRDDVPLPTLHADDWVLVKTKAVALNPTDVAKLYRTDGISKTTPGSISGCDYAGVVEKVGKDVKDLKVGDRIAGFVRGGHPKDSLRGAFAEHIKARQGILAKIPENMSFEDAATLGVGITTVGQGLYQSLKLPLPPAKVQEPTPILIYGASTATGTLAVQYAKLSGLEVIATASPSNFDLLRKLGADQVFDYKDPNVGAKIREATNDNLKLVFDCISAGSTPDISAAAISSKGGHYSSLLIVPKFPRDDVTNKCTLGYTALGETYTNWPSTQEECDQDYEFGIKFWKLAEDLLSRGVIKTHPAEVRPGGLDAIAKGLDDLKNKRVSGAKLVYQV